MDHHLKLECRYRYVYCPLGCKEVIWFATSGTHQSRECPMRRVACKWGCDEEIRALDLDIHQDEQCSSRPFHIQPK